MQQRVLLLIFCVFLLNTFVFSQKLEHELKNYTRKDGLPSNETYCILKDSKNYLWIATDQGVVRFNGVEMKKFELEDNVIFKIKEDEKGRIWFFSHSGKLSYYFEGIIYSYKYNANILKETKNLVITDAIVFDNKILINAQNNFNHEISDKGEIRSFDYRKESDTKKNFIIKIIKKKDILFAQKFSDEFIDHSFLILKLIEKDTITYTIPFAKKSSPHYGTIADGKAIYFFNSNILVKLFPDGNHKSIILPSNILGISIGNHNNIWVGLSKHGAISLSKELEEKEHILQEYSVSSIATDYEGGVWLSTLEKGVFYLNKAPRKLYSNNEAFDKVVYRIFSINDSNFLFANHDGIFKMAANNVLPVFSTKIRFVSDLIVHDNKIMLAGSKENQFGEGGNIFGKSYKTSDKLLKLIYFIISSSQLYEISKGHFYFNWGLGLSSFDVNSIRHSNLGKNFIFGTKGFTLKKGAIFVDKNKVFWLGTLNALLRFNDSLNTLRIFNKNELLFKKGITNMAQMENGLYAIGIRFGGLAIMKDSTIIENITEQDGLSSNSIKYILPHKNYLWVATAKGISIVYFTSFSPLKYKVIKVVSGKDFADITVNHLSYLGKDVLAATNNGIYRFNDSLIIEESIILKPLPFYITAIRYNNIDTTNIPSLSLPYNSARIAIHFNAISFDNGDDIQYRYRIVNNDTNWSYLTNPELLLEKLSSGNYKVHLQALIKYQDRYSEIRELSITVEKPWWQNKYFILITAFIILLFGYAFYQSRIKKINAAAKKELDTKSKFLELEQTAFRSQMNPHFIFNCLSSIQQLIVACESVKANEYLVKFSKLMRLTLEHSANQYNSISDEVSYLSEYISLEQLRFPNQFDFSFDIHSEIDKNNIAIPNMMIQPILENAIKHGIKNIKNRVGFISIKMLMENDALICTIKDNGVGSNKNKKIIDDYKAHKSFGMDIITKRLATFNAEGENKYYMEVIDVNDRHVNSSGSEIILNLPIKKYYDKSHTY